MKLKTKTKDRLLTGGVVLVICAVGLVLPGCGTTTTQTIELKPLCTTDMDCELLERKWERDQARKNERPLPRWKMWTSIGIGVLVTGYLYAHSQDSGGDQRNGAFTIDKSTQPVACGSVCAQ